MTFTSHITLKRTRIIAGLRACIGGEGGEFGVSARNASFMRGGTVSTK